MLINAIDVEEVPLARPDIKYPASTALKRATRPHCGIVRKGRAKGQFLFRIVKALGLADHLAALLPDPEVRPVELVSHAGQHRRRASGKRKTAEPWTWGDEGDDT